MRSLNDVNKTRRKIIEQRFDLPSDTSEVYVDKFNRPYELIAGSKVVCTVKNNNFHLHENKNR